MTIGEKIAIFRRQKGLSQYMLAKNAKVTYSTLNMVEAGKRRGDGLTLATALRLATALGVTLNDLVEGTSDAKDDDEEHAA